MSERLRAWAKSKTLPWLAMYVYTYVMTKSARAKIFSNGGSQAIRLPKSCRFPEGQHEVIAKRVGRRVILEPADEWSEAFMKCLGAWTGEIERPKSKKIADARDPFE